MQIKTDFFVKNRIYSIILSDMSMWDFNLWGERRQWSHLRFSGAVSFIAIHLTNATHMYRRTRLYVRRDTRPKFYLGKGRAEGTTKIKFNS